jgi:SNF2 family DNA or RNA helicase
MNTEQQKEAINKLSKLKVGALFMEMGTGKTKTALDIIDLKSNKVDYILWICPCSLKGEIAAERDKWYPDLQLDIIGCESIGSSDRIYLETLEKIENKKAFIVVDESLKIKNMRAKRTQRILELGKHSEYRLILNGTPVSKNILDLWTQMQFLSPKILDMSFYEFKDTYCEYYTKGKMKGRIRSQVNIPHLISLIEPYIFECKLNISTRKCYRGKVYDLNSRA